MYDENSKNEKRLHAYYRLFRFQLMKYQLHLFLSLLCSPVRSFGVRFYWARSLSVVHVYEKKTKTTGKI